MLTLKTCKIIIVSAALVSFLNACGATHSGSTSGKTKVPVQTDQHVIKDQPPQPRSSDQSGQEIAGSAQISSRESIFGHKESVKAKEVVVNYADIMFVEQRLKQYEYKFEQWLEISGIDPGDKPAEELTALETECVQKLERILTGYNLLLERMLQDKTVSTDKIAMLDPKKMQQLDISFLESRCGEVLAIEFQTQFEFMVEEQEEISFDEALKIIASSVEQGNYQEALLAYSSLTHSFRGQKPPLSTQLNYGLALQYTGQVEAAARHFTTMLDSGDLSIEPLSLQREIADLLLASDNIAAAEYYYDSLILAHESIEAEKSWAVEQLAFLRSVNFESEDMSAYIRLLREFEMYDYRIYGAELNEKINSFAMEYTGSPVAVSALRLKSFTLARLRSWFGRELVKIDALVKDNKFTEATDILKNMTRYYLPAELQAIVQKTFYEVSQAEMQEMETQKRIEEMELTEQWEAAVNLLDSQRFDIAILAFEALMGTEYEERATAKIVETANLAAGRMRKEAASLFIRAGKSHDLEQKKELLLDSHRLLNQILVKYPQTDLLDKVNQNIAILEEQIRKFDPALLEILQEENAAELPGDSPGPFNGKLQ